MNCERAIALISARIDGELSPADSAALESHLAECPACAATAEAFELQDADMRHAFDERRHQAGTVAERVAENLPRFTPADRWRKLRRRARPFLFGVTLAATLAGLAWFLAVQTPPPAEPSKHSPGADTDEPFGGLTPRPRTPAPSAPPIEIGQNLHTKPGERRRATLPDGSILYVNQDTTVTLDRERHLSLSNGEVFVEVTPIREGVGPFVVQTPKREVTAVGTKFDVRADGAQTDVLVTQGSVAATGVGDRILAGRELSRDGTIGDAPRASYRLDWTRDLMAAADTPLVPGSEFSGGALIAVDPYGQQAKLSLRRYHVDVHIEDGFARTTIDQTYFNHANWQLEGTFYFPLPPDASLSRLAMYVDGKRMEGGMVERDFGRQVYEKIVASQRDPALLEWVDGSTFKMRVFPLEARKEKRLILSYTQRLPADYGRLTYRFPAGHSLQVVDHWSFQARVEGGADLAASSPSHPEMTMQKDGGDLILQTAEDKAAVNRDVVLHLADPSAGSADAVRFSGAEADGNRYLMLRYRPALSIADLKSQISHRTWVFLFESSGDRDPLLARTQIEIIRSLLNNAEHSDNFVILAAGTNVRPFATEPKSVTAENVQAGLDFLDKVHLIGALDLGNALAAAEPYLQSATNPYLVHIGSGVAAMGERRDDVLAKRLPDGTRYVGVGVGRRWNRNFMKQAAERSGGYFTQINPDEPVAWRGFELYSSLVMPRLLNIKVTDETNRPFLTFTNSISAGEEIGAAIRLGDGEQVPQSVKVTGSLDGVPFERTLPVRDVATGAGYLPRSWAKLEIERLLAEDAGKNREHIVDLSKAMYVMTPFTSLLVLENEQMYRDNKVDRGRKDHWAIYDCPEKIKVVYEPDENSPPDARHPEDQKPTDQQVLQTILVRVPPRCISWPNVPNGPAGPVQMALHYYGEVTAAPETRLGMRRKERLSKLRKTASMGMDDDLKDSEFGLDAGIPFPPTATWRAVTDFDEQTDSRMGDGIPGDLLEREGLHAALPLLPLPPNLSKIPYRERLSRRSRGSGHFRGDGRRLAPRSAVPDPDQPLEAVELRDLAEKVSEDSPDFSSRSSVNGTLVKPLPTGGIAGIPFDVPYPVVNQATILMNQSENLRQIDSEMERFWMVDQSSHLTPERVHGGVGGGEGRWVYPTVTKSDPANTGKPIFVRLPDYIDHLLSGGGQPRLYGRPSFSGDQRVFTDLASYAPGMNTSRADISAVLDAEAMPRLADLPGHIDAQPRAIIDRARAAGWQKLTFTDKDGKPIFSLTFDGAGRYAYEHTLPNKLVERVVCDGRTLLHLYPDLHIGARRTVSRFHRADFAAIIPGLVLPADDLAHGADVTALDDHTVAVSPKDAATAKDDDGKPIAYVRFVMLFGDGGRLTERRVVLMPKDKVLARETYAADGSIQLFIGDKKEPATAKRSLTPATAPDLKPDVTTFAVLPLPLRSRQTVYSKLEFNWNQPLDVGDNACHAYLNEDAALELFATNYAAQNSRDAALVYRNCLAHDMARAAGFHVLLASCGATLFDSEQLNALRAEKPRDPLLVYLILLDQPQYRRWQPYLGMDTMSALCQEHPFFGPLAGLRDQAMIWQTWTEVDATSPGGGWLRERERRGLDYVKAQRGTAYGWALLGMMYASTAESDKRFHREWADTCALFIDHPAFGYAARYERARALLVAGQRDEARTLFREMFEQAIKASVLPAVDNSFREALQGEPKEADLWTDMMRQTAANFCKDHRRPAAVTLAWECWQLGDQPLASNLLTAALDGIDDENERVLTTLTAVAFLYQTAQHAEADARLRPLLDNDKLAKQPALWRMAGRIADARGLTAHSIECLERALALEYDDLPEVINLEEIRRDYGRLLDHYSSLARAVTAMKVAPPRDLLAKTVRAADCWRALDRDESGRPCDNAATILRLLGATDLAWEYQTTPLGQRPNESGPWLGLAQSLQREGDFRLADRAYVAAFEAEPTNAQILWDRAQSLRQNDQQAEAQKVLRRIVEGDWQSRFGWVRSQARWQLEGR